MSQLNSVLFVVFLFVSTFSFAQSYTSYFTGNPTDVATTPIGGTVLMGGAAESDEAMQWFLERADGGDILVLRASGSDGYNDYLFSELGITVNSVESIVFHNASAASEAYIHDKISKAEAIWFAGGNQWNYVNYWRDTAIQTLINEAVNDRGVVIGGTSAGMAIMGGHYFTAELGTIASNQALNNPYHFRATVSSEPFLDIDYLDDIITDTHYDDPDRRGRQTSFLARIMTDTGIAARGIACDEYTAVCIDTEGIARVYGDYPSSDDNAYFIMSNCELDDRTPEVCIPDTPLQWNREEAALKVYRIKGTIDGTHTFDLNDWTTGSGGDWETWWVQDATLITASSGPVVCNPLSTNTPSLNVELSVYPNPTKNWVTLDAAKLITLVELYDIHGRKQTITLDNSGVNLRLSTSHLTHGMYLLKIQIENNVIVTKKLVKSN